MKTIMTLTICIVCLFPLPSFSEVTYNPETGIVDIPQLKIIGDPNATVYAVQMQSQGATFVVTDISAVQSQKETVSDLSCDLSWQWGFAEYSTVNCEDDNCRMAAGYQPMPMGFGESTKGLFLQSNNSSDDMFMYAKKKIEGLKPDTRYTVKIQAFIASEFCTGMIGIGGSPGESNYIHMGAVDQEPQSLEDDYHTMNISKGNQAQSAGSLEMVGTIGVDCLNQDEQLFQDHFFPKKFSSVKGIDVTSDSEGNIWVIIGNDSGFEGLTRFYLYRAVITLTHQAG